MFTNNGELFESKENEAFFLDICDKLKAHPFPSPWAPCFEQSLEIENTSSEVKEFNIPVDVLELKNIDIHGEIPQSHNDNIVGIQRSKDEISQEKFLPLKTSLESIQDSHFTEEIQCIDVVCSLTLSQIPEFCTFMRDAFLSETSVVVFLNSISNLKKPLSIMITTALVSQIIYPKILNFQLNNYRNLSSAIVKFFTVYPKAILDGILIPCLKRDSLESSIQEILLMLVRSNLSEEHAAYCIQAIAKEALVTENTFMVLQTLIEKKVPFDENLHGIVAFGVGNWTPLYSTNMKFTKVLMSILSIYGSEVPDKHMKIYFDAVNSNKTIMKKAAENILKKIKM